MCVWGGQTTLTVLTWSILKIEQKFNVTWTGRALRWITSWLWFVLNFPFDAEWYFSKYERWFIFLCWHGRQSNLILSGAVLSGRVHNCFQVLVVKGWVDLSAIISQLTWCQMVLLQTHFWWPKWRNYSRLGKIPCKKHYLNIGSWEASESIKLKRKRIRP